MLYDEEHKAVIAYRRAMDGKTHQLDDSLFLVYGDGENYSCVSYGMSIMVTGGSGGQTVNLSGRHTRRVMQKGSDCDESAWRQARSMRWAGTPWWCRAAAEYYIGGENPEGRLSGNCGC